MSMISKPQDSAEKEWEKINFERWMDSANSEKKYSGSVLGQMKNRYSNIHSIPDETVMTTDARKPEETGINYFPGNRVSIGTSTIYISQAPVTSQIDSFLSTLRKNDIHKIYMLTDFVESGVEKSANYLSKTKIVAEGVSEPLINRKLIYKDCLFHHCHFKKWKDHSVPSQVEFEILLVDVIQAVRSGNRILIHCSAGAGRSGVLASILRGILTGETPYTSVRGVQKHRICLVQNEGQYRFVRSFLSPPNVCKFLKTWYNYDYDHENKQD